MIGSLTPILYDFRRAFFRLSTLLLLILFTIAGVGISYLVVSSITQQYPATNIAAVLIEFNNTCILNGYLYDLAGNPISGKLVVEDYTGNTVYSVDVHGNFTLEDTRLCELLYNRNLKVVVESDLGRFNANIRPYQGGEAGGESSVAFLYTGDASITFLPSKISGLNLTSVPPVTPPSQYRGFPVEEVMAGAILYRLIIVSWSTSEARLIVCGVNFSGSDTFKPDIVIEYGFKKLNKTGFMVVVGGGNFENVSFKPLGVLRNNYVGVYSLRLNTSADMLVLKLLYDNTTYYLSTDYSMKPAVDTLYVQSLLTFNVGYSLFTQFFPLVFLYLAYVLMAKPRSTGALEFIVARPITRWDLYLTRYLAGVLTAVVAPALFLLGINLANQFLVGVTLDLYSNTILYLGLIASLTSFYTLCYMIASSTRSGLYLALSIITYILFAMFWGLIVLLYSFLSGGGFLAYGENLYRVSYLNPLSPATTYAPYYVQKHYNVSPLIMIPSEEELVDPILTTIAPITWIAVTFTIGYLIFKRINLTS